MGGQDLFKEKEVEETLLIRGISTKEIEATEELLITGQVVGETTREVSSDDLS